MKLGAGGYGVVYKVSVFTLTTDNDCHFRNYDFFYCHASDIVAVIINLFEIV